MAEPAVKKYRSHGHATRTDLAAVQLDKMENDAELQ